MIKKNFLELKKLFIAEIGNNHEGSFTILKKLVNSAIDAGADAVKFQIFKTENFQSKKDLNRFNKLKKFEISYDHYKKIFKILKEKKIKIIATPLDLESLKFIGSHVDIIKIASGDNNFFELIEKALKYKKKLIISTGLMELKLLNKLLTFLKKKRVNKSHICLMHCVSSYPTDYKNANLSLINYLKRNSNYEIGYSDHTKGIDITKMAISMGVKIIEKHFTLSKNFSAFRDHKLSITKKEFRELNSYFNSYSIAYGNKSKKIIKSEKQNYKSSRRSPYSKKLLNKGHIIQRKDIIFLRPEGYFSFQNYYKILGKTVRKKINAGDEFNFKNTGVNIK